MKVFFVRHGQTLANINPREYPWDNNCPLTELGEQQATRAAQWLRDQQIKPQHLLVSPKLRTQQTAEKIVAELGTPIETAQALTEMNAGDWNAWTDEKVYGYLQALPVAERFLFRPPSGESWEESGVRVIAQLAEYEDPATIIIVSHYAPLQAAIATLLGAPFSEWRQYDFPNASVSLLEHDAGEWKAQFVGRVF